MFVSLHFTEWTFTRKQQNEFKLHINSYVDLLKPTIVLLFWEEWWYFLFIFKYKYFDYAHFSKLEYLTLSVSNEIFFLYPLFWHSDKNKLMSLMQKSNKFFGRDFFSVQNQEKRSMKKARNFSSIFKQTDSVFGRYCKKM